MSLIILFFLIWVGVAIYHHFLNRYDKPWFKGSQIAYTCKRPWYNLSDCYTLSVASDGKEITTIYFNNGGYLTQNGGECYKAVADVGNDKHNCTLIDQHGDTWDVFPIKD